MKLSTHLVLLTALCVVLNLSNFIEAQKLVGVHFDTIVNYPNNHSFVERSVEFTIVTKVTQIFENMEERLYKGNVELNGDDFMEVKDKYSSPNADGYSTFFIKFKTNAPVGYHQFTLKAVDVTNFPDITSTGRIMVSLNPEQWNSNFKIVSSNCSAPCCCPSNYISFSGNNIQVSMQSSFQKGKYPCSYDPIYKIPIPNLSNLVFFDFMDETMKFKVDIEGEKLFLSFPTQPTCGTIVATKQSSTLPPGMIALIVILILLVLICMWFLIGAIIAITCGVMKKRSQQFLDSEAPLIK